MLIRLCAYILLAALTLQSLYRSIMTVEYHINLTEYLAQCHNRNQPELHCDGHCVLMSKINDGETDHGKRTLLHYDYNVFYIHREIPFYTLDSPRQEALHTPLLTYQSDYLYNYHTSIFRPPIA